MKEMNKRIFLFTATFVTLILSVLFCVNCMLDESSYEHHFDKISRPVCRVLAGPVGYLIFLVFGKTSKGLACDLMFLLFIAGGSGILWGFIVERFAHFIKIIKRKGKA